MVGNSLASDIVPALDAGAWGIHVPSDYNWVLDQHEGPADRTRFRLIRELGELFADRRRDRVGSAGPARCGLSHV